MRACATLWACYLPARGGSTRRSRSSRKLFGSNRTSMPLEEAWKPHWRAEAEGSVLDAQTFQRSLGGVVPRIGCSPIPTHGLGVIHRDAETLLVQYADGVDGGDIPRARRPSEPFHGLGIIDGRSQTIAVEHAHVEHRLGVAERRGLAEPAHGLAVAFRRAQPLQV